MFHQYSILQVKENPPHQNLDLLRIVVNLTENIWDQLGFRNKAQPKRSFSATFNNILKTEWNITPPDNS